MVKKLMSFILVFSMLFTNITFVSALTNMPDEKIDVPEGTFDSHLQADELSDFVSKSDGEVTTDTQGVTLSKKADTDHYALLNSDKKYNSFVYEADVKLIDGISAGLIVGVSDQNDVKKSWYAINFNTTETQNRGRLFKVENDTVINHMFNNF